VGLSADCEVRFAGRVGSGRAELESAKITFRGAFRIAISLGEIRSLKARNGILEVVWESGQASFVLGASAEAWAARIRNPRTRIDKLGVHERSRVSIVGVGDLALLQELRARASRVTKGRIGANTDILLVQFNLKRDLERLERLKNAMPDDGAIWAVWPKGREALREGDVRSAALKAGLVDVKVVSISDSLSGLKLVVPLAQRGRKS